MGRTVVPGPEVVEPVWLIKAFLGMVLIALACGYLTLCGLFYRGQWQLVLHPARTTAAPATVGGVPFETVHFGAALTGVPQLTGWWIPAGPGAAYAHVTVLYLPGGDGSLADDQATLARLHDVGLSVFAVDYRGYGQSAEMHPGEASMAADAESAWAYLTNSRAILTDRIVPYGRGLGASLALGLAATKGVASAVILDQPDFGVVERVRGDARSWIVPVRLLLKNRFALEPALEETRIPKLILSREDSRNPSVLRAADPKWIVTLPTSDVNGYSSTLRRFLDQYAPSQHVPSQHGPGAPAPGLVSRPAPAPEKTL